MAQDRPDLCVLANVLSGSIAKPRVGGEALVKKVCRYLRWHPACAHCQSRQAVENEVKVLTDSDSGGDKTTRRSTSGLVVQMGDHVMIPEVRGDSCGSSGPRLGGRCTESVKHLEVKSLWEQDLVSRRGPSVIWMPRRTATPIFFFMD